jgi:hypothetical protein
MPCSDGHSFDRSNPHEEMLIRKKLDARTDMLCRVLFVLENSYPDIYSEIVTTDIAEWHIEHKRFDSQRKPTDAREGE